MVATLCAVVTPKRPHGDVGTALFSSFMSMTFLAALIWWSLDGVLRYDDDDDVFADATRRNLRWLQWKMEDSVSYFLEVEVVNGRREAFVKSFISVQQPNQPVRHPSGTAASPQWSTTGFASENGGSDSGVKQRYISVRSRVLLRSFRLFL